MNRLPMTEAVKHTIIDEKINITHVFGTIMNR